MADVTWLHLSDLHIGKSEKDQYYQEQMINDLVDDIKRQIEEHQLNIDFVFISGDISFSGHEEDLELAGSFLKKIIYAARVDAGNVFMVPGNHDITRSKELEKSLERFKEQKCPDHVSPSNIYPEFSTALKNYTSFANQFAVEDIYGPGDLFYERKRVKSGKTVSILGLNTAWSAVKDVHPGSVVLGGYQVRKTLQEAKNSDIIIALMHHPFSWLSEKDNDEAKSLLNKRSDFILTGHVHAVSDIGKGSMFGNAFCITAGAVYGETGNFSNSYNITKCDLTTGIGNIFFRQYVNTRGGYWTADNTISPEIPDGIVSFQLPERIKIEKTEEQRNFTPTLPTQKKDKESLKKTPQVPKALIDDIKAGKCYLFAGAGTSKDAGLPDWVELLYSGIDTLYNRVQVDEEEQSELLTLLNEKQFLIVGDYLRYRLREQWFGDYIKCNLSTKGRRSSRHEILAQIPFRVIITANYDDFIETNRKNARVLLPNDLKTDGFAGIERILEDNNTPVIKLHGTYDRASTIVFGDSEYTKLLYNSDIYRETVYRLLSEKTCLFIGYGFADPNIQAFLQSIHEQKGENAPRHYAIMRKAGPVKTRYFKEKLNIEPIFISDYTQINPLLYDIRDRIIQNKGS